MIHSLVPAAVIRKTKTVPPDTIIGNTEMAACIGLIYKDAKMGIMPEFETPQELYDDFISNIENVDTGSLSETSVKMIDMLKQYHVLPLKNETIEDLNKILRITLLDEN